jgi:hypothetical protein
LPAQEDGERRAAQKHVELIDGTTLRVKTGKRLVEWATGETVQCAVAVELGRDARKQVGRIPAVVVGESDDFSRRERKPGVSSAGETTRRADVFHGETLRIFCEQRVEAVVGILIDDDKLESAMGLRLEMLQKVGQLIGATDSGEHQ